MSGPYVESAAVVSGFAAAYLARVLRRHLRRDLIRDGLPGEPAVEVEATFRAIEQAAASWQRKRVTAQPVAAEPVASSPAMVTTDQAAGLLGIGEPAVRKRIRAGSLPGLKRGDGRWLLDGDAVRAAAHQGRG